MVDVVAVETAHSIVDEMFGSVRQSLQGSGSDVPMTNTLADTITKVQEGVNEERRISAESVAGVTAVLEMYKNVRDNLNTKASLNRIN